MSVRAGEGEPVGKGHLEPRKQGTPRTKEQQGPLKEDEGKGRGFRGTCTHASATTHTDACTDISADMQAYTHTGTQRCTDTYTCTQRDKDMRMHTHMDI